MSILLHCYVCHVCMYVRQRIQTAFNVHLVLTEIGQRDASNVFCIGGQRLGPLPRVLLLHLPQPIMMVMLLLLTYPVPVVMERQQTANGSHG